ncbi:MAG: hypothetical protein EOO63_04860 [Hymenobacter sp.]|nr:MAG: hypothetical protein EOO63_04860 [Hymenobacter sp.]
MKTYSTTSFNQLEGYLGGFAAPMTLRVVRGYHSSAPAGLRCPPRAPSTGYRSPPAVASDGEPGYNQFARCLALFILLLVARAVAGLPPVAAGSPALNAPEGYFAGQVPAASITPWELLAAPPPGPDTYGPEHLSARAGPLPPEAISASY